MHGVCFPNLVLREHCYWKWSSWRGKTSLERCCNVLLGFSLWLFIKAQQRRRRYKDRREGCYMDLRVNSCISLCMFTPLVIMETACSSTKLPCQPKSSSTLPEYLLTVLEEPAHSGVVCCVSYKKHRCWCIFQLWRSELFLSFYKQTN